MSQKRRLVCRATFFVILLISVTTGSLYTSTNCASSVTSTYEGQMTDAHAHMVQWSSPLMVIGVLELYRQAGVYKVIFFDGDGVLEAHQLRPNEIVPSFFVEHMNRTSSISEVESALNRGFLWVGEALLRHWGETNVPADDPTALEIYNLCATHRVPITIHHDSADYSGAYDELERALDHNPNCIFIFHGWWHGYEHLTVKDLENLIVKYPNLYVELAGQLESSPGPPWTEQTFLGGTEQDPFAYPDGRIKEVWRDIFEEYPSRFINGFDLFTLSAYTLENLTIRVQYWRNLLGQLSRDAAEKIAFRNVENLLQNRIHSQIGVNVQAANDWPYTISVTGRINPSTVNGSVAVQFVDPTGIRVRHEVTARNGVFEDSLAPNLTGDWFVQAAWDGNQELLGCESPMMRVRVLIGGIVIDGSAEDWRQLEVAPLIVDPQGDKVGGVPGTDIRSVYVAMDDKYLYLMFELYDGISTGARVQHCFEVDADCDGDPDYQPGFDLYECAWIWNLTGSGYSDPRNLSTLRGAEAVALDVIEFKMPLTAINSPSRMTLAPWFVIEMAGNDVVLDSTDTFEVSRPKDELPPTVLPVMPVIKDAETWIFNASTNTVYFIRTGNIYDDSALGFYYSKCLNQQNIILQTDATKINQTSGRPMVSGSIIAFGGRFANKVTRYYEDQGLAKIVFSQNSTHYMFMKGSTVAYAVAKATYNCSREDYFVMQVLQDNSRLVFLIWGIEYTGTYASGISFADIVYPNLTSYNEVYYIFKWADLDGNGIQTSNEITQVASGS